MQILQWPANVRFLAVDVDGTVYPESRDYIKHQRQAEIEAAAQVWGTDYAGAQERLFSKAMELERSLGRRPSAAEVIRSSDGLSQEWLVEVRIQYWRPDRYLKPELGLPEKILQLTSRYQVAFASTSPSEVVRKIFHAIGFDELFGQVTILGGGDANPKPSSDIYRKVIDLFGLPAGEGLSIGDRVDFDAQPAIAAGMGAVVVSSIAEFREVVDRLLEER